MTLLVFLLAAWLVAAVLLAVGVTRWLRVGSANRDAAAQPHHLRGRMALGALAAAMVALTVGAVQTSDVLRRQLRRGGDPEARSALGAIAAAPVTHPIKRFGRKHATSTSGSTTVTATASAAAASAVSGISTGGPTGAGGTTGAAPDPRGRAPATAAC